MKVIFFVVDIFPEKNLKLQKRKEKVCNVSLSNNKEIRKKVTN